MPKIQKVFELNVSPQKYVNACDVDELKELIMIAHEAIKRHNDEDTVRNYKDERGIESPQEFINDVNQ